VAALDELERIVGSLNQAEVWVVRNDADAEGELAEQAAEEDRRGMLGPRIAAAGEGAGPPGRDDARRGERLPGQAAL
jgi:hypothetical protein